MRITNGMMRNNSLNSLYTNMERLDTVFAQMNTLKKIQRPSDDPIVAGRSLKLRINVMEAEQHKKNVDEAKAWMDVTETALGNMTKILTEIRTRSNQAANSTLTPDDKQKIVNDIEQLYKQLQQEANGTYAGRYVFSGFKTDQPVYLDKDTKLEKGSTISKDLVLAEDKQINKGTTFGKDVRLPHAVTLTEGIVTTQPITLPDSTVIPAGTTLRAGDIMPKGSTIGAGQALPENVTFEKDSVIPAGSKLEGQVALEGDITLTADATRPDGTKILAGTTLPKGTVLPVGTMLPKGTLNPEVLGKINGQDMEYEIGVGTTVDINTLGVPGLMGEIGKDLQSIIAALQSKPPLSDEKLNKLFNDMLGTMDERLSTVSEMTASLGSRQKRLEYTESRLIDDKTNLKELLSKTEDVDLEDTYVEFNTQYMIYQSALQATSKVIMTNLGDFLR